MDRQKRKAISSGVMLILVGAAFLAFQMMPNLRNTFFQEFTWPMYIMLVALGLLLIGGLTGEPDMLVPACIVGGIGGLLYAMNEGFLTWGSWAYVWTLIPGFAGIGVLLSGLLQWKTKEIMDGIETMITSAVMFLIFGSLMGGLFGWFPFTQLLPFVLIGWGMYLLIKNIVIRSRQG